MAAAAPVSYTHLDVYKRQLILQNNISCIKIDIVPENNINRNIRNISYNTAKPIPNKAAPAATEIC